MREDCGKSPRENSASAGHGRMVATHQENLLRDKATLDIIA